MDEMEPLRRYNTRNAARRTRSVTSSIQF